MSADLETAKQVQEQTQIIASAIGKPAAKAPTIVTVNAKTRFASGRTLSNPKFARLVRRELSQCSGLGQE
jgi:hypothetical protein